MNSVIVIADYDPAWPALYECERHAIAGALSAMLTAIEHIGSTAVPGLAAKPVVDIMAGLGEDVALDTCVGPLQILSYEYVAAYEDVMPFRRFFKKRPPEHAHAFNLHVVHADDAFWKRHLAFRDHLRGHPDTARAYEQVKRELAPRYTDVNEYAEAKTPFIESVSTWLPQNR